jgi:DinB superfamily
MKNDLSQKINDTKNDLLVALDTFRPEKFNVIPFDGSWTAGQVAEHILKSASAMLQTMNGPVKIADRDPGQYMKPLGDAFLNFDIKMQSPDFIIPSDEPKDKAVMMHSLDETFEGIKDIAETDDLDMICTGFEMPMLGLLSKKEFIWFTYVHTQRHIHQLKNIAKHFAN